MWADGRLLGAEPALPAQAKGGWRIGLDAHVARRPRRRARGAGRHYLPSPAGPGAFRIALRNRPKIEPTPLSML